jgi:hypothetical protein
MSFAQLNQVRRVFRCWHFGDIPRRGLMSGSGLFSDVNAWPAYVAE